MHIYIYIYIAMQLSNNCKRKMNTLMYMLTNHELLSVCLLVSIDSIHCSYMWEEMYIILFFHVV